VKLVCIEIGVKGVGYVV